MPNIAVVGSGYWGRNLVRNFSQIGVLHTICDSDINRLKELKKGYPDVNVVAGFYDVLNMKEIDAVVIATPAEHHYQMAKEVILSGKDIFVEKPLALTVSQGIELTRLAEDNNRILMVGHLLEYHHGILKLKEIIDKGELGKIQYIYSNRLNLGKIRREENILWSFAPHDISVILLLLNEMPKEVSAHGGNYLHQEIADVTVSNLSFANGVRCHIFVSWLHPYKEQKLIVIGDKKMAVFDDVSEQEKLLLYPHRIDWIERIPVPCKEDADVIQFDMAEPLREECIHFLHSIETRERPKTDGNNGIRVLEVLQACQQSLEENGKTIPIKKDTYYSLPIDRGDSQIGTSNDYFSHPTSTIDEPCEIGRGSRIWHYSHIMKGAKIGKNCSIGQNVFIGGNVILGDNVKVQNNVSIYEGVEIEDGVFCGPSMVFTNVINPRSHISRRDEFKPTFVREGATIGANATILCGITIGRYAFIGAGAVVTNNVPDYGLVYGVPAEIKGWMCECGVKLSFSNKKGRCNACANEYRREGDNIYSRSKKMVCCKDKEPSRTEGQ
jgi:UDP-2-acetamido-3-amino-2,3-dideoxy-glucuronate N-acetyltransferase